jgi:hypothetical protein
MRALVLVVALTFGCKRASPLVKADPDDKKAKVATIVIRKSAPRVGMRARVKNTTDTTMTVAGMPGLPASPFELKERVERTEEILAVEGRIVTRVRVIYDVYDTTNTITGSAPARTPSAVEGNTYVVGVTKTGLEIVDAKGKPPAPDAQLVIERDYRSLGKEEEISGALPDVPIHVGDAAPALASAIKSKLAEKQMSGIKGNLDVRVDAANDESVTFGVKGTLVVAEPSIDMSIVLTGKISVRVSDGSITEYSFAGPVTLGSDAGLNGTGTFSYVTKWTYLTPPK